VRFQLGQHGSTSVFGEIQISTVPVTPGAISQLHLIRAMTSASCSTSAATLSASFQTTCSDGSKGITRLFATGEDMRRFGNLGRRLAHELKPIQQQVLFARVPCPTELPATNESPYQIDEAHTQEWLACRDDGYGRNYT